MRGGCVRQPPAAALSILPPPGGGQGCLCGSPAPAVTAAVSHHCRECVLTDPEGGGPSFYCWRNRGFLPGTLLREKQVSHNPFLQVVQWPYAKTMSFLKNEASSRVWPLVHCLQPPSLSVLRHPCSAHSGTAQS